ncbi:hypothetical protein Btru_045519 [Bulinus truncatus]|nr:hypothetical protein Btru_045519 [Bulinus truncatus]
MDPPELDPPDKCSSSPSPLMLPTESALVLIAMLIGSIESDVHHKTSYDIREFISHLAKFLRSGGLADFLAELLEIKQKESLNTLNKKIEAAASYIPLPKGQANGFHLDQAKILNSIKEIVTLMDKQVQVLDISKKLEEIKITEVIFKAVDGAERRKNKSNTHNFIMLCLHLDQLEIAAEIGGLWEVVEKKNTGLCKQIIKDALLLKRYSFIRYLLEQGLNPNDFIKAVDVSPTFEKMLKAEETKNKKDSKDSLHKDKKMTPKQKRMALLITEFCGQQLSRHSLDQSDVNPDGLVDENEGAALYAYKILKSLRQLEPHLEHKMKIKEWMKEFQHYAIETINRTYNKQPGEAIKLLGQKMDNWGKSTCLMLALTSGNKKFLSQLACREFNNRVWYFGSLIGTKESSQEYTVGPEYDHSLDKKCCSLSEEVKDIVRDFFAPSVLASFRFLIRNPIKIFPIYPLSLFFLLESGSILLFAVAWGFRLAVYYFPEHTDFIMVARVLFSLDFITFAIFTLEVCCIHSFFGPILLMIMKMFKTLLTFLLIVLIFFGGYAVASESVLYPESSMSPTLAFYLLRKAFWAMFGEFMLEELEGHSCTNDPALYSTHSTLRCPTTTGSYFVPPLMGVYYIIVNIMLFSLLIALFSSTIKKVSNQALEVWHHQSLQMTLKYGKVIILPPPFTIFTPLLWLCRSKDVDQPFSKEVTRQNLVNLKKIEVDEQRNFIQYLDVKGSLPVCQCNFVCEHKGSDSDEIKKIYIKDKGSQTDSYEWVPTYGSITGQPLSKKAEKILNDRDASKEPRKYFAVRTKKRYGVGWKVVSIKKVKKVGNKKTPPGILPELKYLD